MYSLRSKTICKNSYVYTNIKTCYSSTRVNKDIILSKRHEICEQNVKNYVQLVGFILASHATPQLAVTCSKLIIETVEQGVNYVHKLRRLQNDAIGVTLVSLLLTLNAFQTLF